jgi:anti-sigma B factor antagonist
MEVSSKFNEPIVEEQPECLVAGLLFARGGGGRLRLVGELDIAGVPALRAVLASVDGDVEIDCSGLTFIDCAGLRVLQETQRACETAGVRLLLIGPSRCVTRLIDLSGLSGFFDVCDSSNP